MNDNKDFLNEKIEVLTNLYAVFRDERDVFEKIFNKNYLI